MTEVKFFLKRRISELERDINYFLNKNFNRIEVIDIKYNFIANKYLDVLAFSAMIIYKNKE